MDNNLTNDHKVRSDKSNDIKISDIINIPKKRGRKPKIQTNNSPKDSKKMNKIKNNKILIDKKIDICSSKELDLFDIPNNHTNNYVDNQMSNIWVNKYKPTHINNIIGNKENITKIQNWLINFPTSKYHAAIISGGHGVGKNIITRLILDDVGYLMKNIYSTSLKNKNIVSELIQSCAKTKSLISSIDIVNKKYAIVIDDTESITLSSEKDNLLELFKINSQKKYFPIIFICNLQHSKLINNLKKISLNVTLFAPSVEQIKKYISQICKNEGMIINDDTYYEIIKYCQCDIRRLIFVLQDLYYTYNKEPITLEMFKEYQRMSQRKDIDIGLYFAAKSLLDNYKNINQCLQLYETEKVLLPLTIYENYNRKIYKQKLRPNDILYVMSGVTNSVSIGDVIETNIYTDQNWFLQNIHGFYTCAETSYIINSINPKENIKLNYDVGFSADLNRTSSKNINKKKNIMPLQNKFKNKTITDILYINKILYELDKHNIVDTIKDIKSVYKLDNNNIQIALKIDKTNDNYIPKRNTSSSKMTHKKSK
jgi:replication factor C subunit 1